MSESYRGSPRQHHCVLCTFFSSPLSLSLYVCLSPFLVSLTHTRLFVYSTCCRCCCCCPYRTLAGKSFSHRGEASHRTARPRLAPAVIELKGKKRRSRRRRVVVVGGSVQLSTPPMQQNQRGLHFLLYRLASTNHVALFPSSIITGSEGRKEEKKKKKKIRHSTSFSRSRLRFPDVQICLL